MTLIQRRFLTFFLGLLLITVSPLLILYAAGYRYNFEKNRVEKVGLLYVTTDPNNTKIQVDGQEYRVGNELVLRSLSQGEHAITLVADGYMPWSKTLDIYKGQSTFITDQILFLDEEQEPFELFTNKLTHLVSKEDISLFQSESFLFVYRFSTGTVQEHTLPSSIPLNQISFSPESNKITFLQNDTWFEMGLEDGTYSGLPVDENTLVQIYGNQIYGVTDTSLELITEGSVETLFSLENIQSLYPTNNAFWVIASDASNKHSFVYKLEQTNAIPLLIDQLPYSESYLIDEDYRGFLTIHDQTNEILYLVDTRTAIPTTEALFGVREWQWNRNHSALLTSTEFELTIHHFDDGISQELLMRLSSPIHTIEWYQDESHVFYTNQDSLYLVERDERDRRNVYELGNVSEDHIILGSDEEKIEFFSSLETSSLFVRRNLRN